MKTIHSIILGAITSILLSSCVSRTISTSPPLGKGGDSNVATKKILWIWQDEYRNP
jgi:hypothetical protein